MRNMKSKIISAGLFGAMLVGLTGCTYSEPPPPRVVEREVITEPAPPPPYVEREVIVTEGPPPPPRVEVVTVRPYRTAVWYRGYWAHTHHGYYWVHGYWR